MNQFPNLENRDSYAVLAALLKAYDGFKVVLNIMPPAEDDSIRYAEDRLLDGYPKAASAFENLKKRTGPLAYILQKEPFLPHLPADDFYLITIDEQRQFFGNNIGFDDSWKAYRRHFGKKAATFSFSMVGFSDDMRFAVCYIGATFGPLAGAGHFVLQGAKEDGLWEILDRVMLWIS